MGRFTFISVAILVIISLESSETLAGLLDDDSERNDLSGGILEVLPKPEGQKSPKSSISQGKQFRKKSTNANENISSTYEAKLKEQFSVVLSELRQIRSEIREARQEHGRLATGVAEISDQIDGISDRKDQIKKKIRKLTKSLSKKDHQRKFKGGLRSLQEDHEKILEVISKVKMLRSAIHRNRTLTHQNRNKGFFQEPGAKKQNCTDEDNNEILPSEPTREDTKAVTAIVNRMKNVYGKVINERKRNVATTRRPRKTSTTLPFSSTPQTFFEDKTKPAKQWQHRPLTSDSPEIPTTTTTAPIKITTTRSTTTSTNPPTTPSTTTTSTTTTTTTPPPTTTTTTTTTTPPPTTTIPTTTTTVETTTTGPLPMNCYEVLQHGNWTSGIYTINPPNMKPVQVWCDQRTDGGGWTVILARKPQAGGQEDFSRGWADYKAGFGEPGDEHWLGLETMHKLTQTTRHEVRVNMTDWNDNDYQAVWREFKVGPEDRNYKLLIQRYSSSTSTAADAMKWHNGMKFSAVDRDNDVLMGGHCALNNRSGWWYRGFRGCYQAHPTGVYREFDPASATTPATPAKIGRKSTLGPYIYWVDWRGNDLHPKTVFFMIRPILN